MAGAPAPAVPSGPWLDFQCGIGVANTGHAHPRVAAAVAAQAARGIHLQQTCVISRPVVELIGARGGGARLLLRRRRARPPALSPPPVYARARAPFSTPQVA